MSGILVGMIPFRQFWIHSDYSYCHWHVWNFDTITFIKWNKRALLLPEAACALFSCYCSASLKSAFQLSVSQQSKIILKQKVSCSDTAESQFECHPSLCFIAITKLLWGKV